jgi:hypothetical protein
MSFDCYDARSFRRQRVKEVAIALGLATAVAVAAIFAHPAKAEARPRKVIDANGVEAQVIGGRPAGCPHAYCGCGLARFLGLSDKRLNLAWAWAKLFPRTQAQPGAAAVRHHHVMLLVEHLGGTIWRVRDYNGGRGLAWLHARDVRGYVFVQPSRSFAMN